MKSFLADKRKALGYDQAPEVERLMIDRVLCSWLRVQQAELRKSSAESERVSLPWALTWDRRLETANKNFLRAIKVLALMRRRPMPHTIMQVNVGAADVAVGPRDETQVEPVSARR